MDYNYPTPLITEKKSLFSIKYIFLNKKRIESLQKEYTIMEKRKPIEKDTQKLFETEKIDKIFLKKIENLKEKEQKFMLKLYKEILRDIK